MLVEALQAVDVGVFAVVPRKWLALVGQVEHIVSGHFPALAPRETDPHTYALIWCCAE